MVEESDDSSEEDNEEEAYLKVYKFISCISTAQ
jgi:hypothetical protein